MTEQYWKLTPPGTRDDGTTDSAEQLHTIRDHLRTGRFGQREAWEEWLTEAAAEIARLERHIKDLRELRGFDRADIERLNGVIKTGRLCDPRYCTFGNENEIARLRNDYSILKRDYDALREDWNELVQVARDARRALEPKP